MAKDGQIADAEAASREMLASVDNAFAPLGVKAGIEKKIGPQKKAYCVGCGKILEGKVVTAMDEKWHIDCFKCSQCDRQIEGNYTVRDGNPWCEKCIEFEQGLPKPTKKKAAPVPTEIVVERKVKEVDQDIDVMRGFKAKICAKCGQKIIVGVDYEDLSYCLQCFTCGRCDKVINTEDGFSANKGQVYCRDCTAELNDKSAAAAASNSGKKVKCAGCNQMIDGKYMKMEGKPYHEECFVCSQCQGSLADGYATKGNKKLCSDCASKVPEVVAKNVSLSEPIQGIRFDQIKLEVKAADNNPVAKSAKFCDDCGAKLGGKFCTGCGKKVTA